MVNTFLDGAVLSAEPSLDVFFLGTQQELAMRLPPPEPLPPLPPLPTLPTLPSMPSTPTPSMLFAPSAEPPPSPPPTPPAPVLVSPSLGGLPGALPGALPGSPRTIAHALSSHAEHLDRRLLMLRERALEHEAAAAAREHELDGRLGVAQRSQAALRGAEGDPLERTSSGQGKECSRPLSGGS
jgi:hypothetical protein